ncbi:cupredoxin domain-containing protein [Gaopeijia maritima]|uniref:Cupredoxin family copper-binding protein n=1 Tax=Gaopeijia maritima TaxID=3119007 RepID=A0ABU9EAU9_9BACT
MSRPAARTMWRLAAFAPLLAACAGGDRPPPRHHTVEIRDMAFHPAELRVAPGDTVTWTNRDFVPHTATAPDSAWTSPPLAKGESWQMVVRAPGRGTYICAYHPTMRATLVALATPPVPEIDP